VKKVDLHVDQEQRRVGATHAKSAVADAARAAHLRLAVERRPRRQRRADRRLCDRAALHGTSLAHRVRACPQLAKQPSGTKRDEELPAAGRKGG